MFVVFERLDEEKDRLYFLRMKLSLGGARGSAGCELHSNTKAGRTRTFK
jgi:hypothetical protein